MASVVRSPPALSTKNRFSPIAEEKDSMVSLGKISRKRARANTSLDSSSASIPSPKRTDFSFDTSTPEKSLVTPAQHGSYENQSTANDSGFDLERAMFPDLPKQSYAQVAADSESPPSPTHEATENVSPPSPASSTASELDLEKALNPDSPTQPETVPTVSPSPPPSPVSSPSSPATVIWTFFTIQIIGIALQRAKLETLIRELVQYVGPTFIRVDQVQSKSFRIKVREDHIGRAKSFQYAATDLSFKKLDQYKSKKTDNARGLINIPADQDFAKFETELKKNNSGIASIKQNFEFKNNEKVPTKTASVIFNNEEAPVKLRGLTDLVKPVFLSVIRCQKCQMFGHKDIKNSCRNAIKCPHCAGSHSHSQCKNRQEKKCANCQGCHSAAYRGCSYFLAYQRKINGSNAAIELEYNNKCAAAGVTPPTVNKPQSHSTKSKPQSHSVTNKDITLLAKRIENKPASEIIEILRKEFGSQFPETKNSNNKGNNSNDSQQSTESSAINNPAPARPTPAEAPLRATRPTVRPVQHPHVRRYPTPPRRPDRPSHIRGARAPPPLMSRMCPPTRQFPFQPQYGRYGPPYPRFSY